MAFFSRLFRIWQRAPSLIRLDGNSCFAVDVMGTQHYQGVIQGLVGKGLLPGRAQEAVLFCDDDNPHDERAVIVTLDGEIVGYLGQVEAARHRRRMRDYGRPNAPARCTAVIVDAWSRRCRSGGRYAVWLDWPDD